MGLDAIKPWGHLGDIGAAVNAYAREHGYTVVREFGGHGIGLEFHEDPFVSFVTEAGTGPILVPGLCFTIEPMINAGAQEIDMTDPQRLDGSHRRSLAHGPMGSPTRHHRRRLRAAQLVEGTDSPATVSGNGGGNLRSPYSSGPLRFWEGRFYAGSTKNPFSERSFPMTENTNQTPGATAGYGPEGRELERESHPTASPLAPLATSRPPLRAMRARCSAVLQSQELNPDEPAVTNDPPLCRRNPVATHQAAYQATYARPAGSAALGSTAAAAPAPTASPHAAVARLPRPPSEDAQDHRSRAGLPAFAA